MSGASAIKVEQFLGGRTRLRVLYLHPASAFGGAAKSLIELFGLLRVRGIEGTVLTPRGPVCAGFAKAGFRVCPVRGLSQFDNTRFGHYRRLRWLVLLRELWFLPFSAHAFWMLRKEAFDLIHVNEITLLPLGVLAKWFMGVPLVVHVRSLQCTPKSSWRTRVFDAWLRKYADAVIAIDHTVRGTLAKDLPVRVIHNGIILRSGVLSASGRADGAPVRVGFLGVLLPLKGVFELVDAMRILRDRGVRVKCVIAGDNIRELTGIKAWLLAHFGFARDVRADLLQYITHHSLQDMVTLTGFVDDVSSFYSGVDILCFPSHLNAAGRPVFEAALHGIPSIVAVDNPSCDAIIDGVTGLAITKPEPKLIADAIQKLVESEHYRKELGIQALQWVKKYYSIERSAQEVFGIYKKIICNVFDARKV